jgi:hypothetical protein
MFILEEPFVSQFLADSIRESGSPVLDTAVARAHLLDSPELLLESAEFARRAVESRSRVYANSENALAWVAEHLAETDLPRQAAALKDKVGFRELVSRMHPDYVFREVSVDELGSLDVSQLPVPFVIKPAVGFFSVGVHVVDSPASWPAVVTAIRDAVTRSERLYPDQVLGLDRFVIEEVIEGEEFAVDAYFRADGTPVVLNVMAHLFASDEDVSDRVYYTTPAMMEEWRGPFAAYLAEVGRLAHLHDFPVHAELRVDAAGRIAPIEINPLRFGGWCAGDMAWYAHGIDPYACYLGDVEPDWSTLDAGREGTVTALVVADFPSSIERETIESVDYDALLARFSKPLDLRRTDFRRYPVFAFAFVETRESDMSELRDVLHADLGDYLRFR